MDLKDYDLALREAIEDYLFEHGDMQTEYGPKGSSINWFYQEDIMKAIKRAEVPQK